MNVNVSVILDFDDVLAPSNEKALETINSQLGCNYQLSDICAWGIMGSPLDERLHLFAEPSFIGSLPLYQGAQEFVSKLSKIANVIIATAVEPECAAVRFKSIRKYFPIIPTENIYIGKSKGSIKADYMLDDGVHNLERSSATTPVLFRRPWNEKETKYVAVSDYNEFLELLNKN